MSIAVALRAHRLSRVDHREDAQAWRALRPEARLYVGAVVGIGGGLIAASLPRAFDHNLLLLAALGFLSVLAAIAKVTLPVPRSASTLTICYVLDFITLLLLGAPAATVTAALGAWSQCTFRQRATAHRFQTWFSTGALAITVQATGLAYEMLGGSPGLPLATFHADALATAAAVFFLTNSLLVAAAVAVTTQQSTLTVWRTTYVWSWPGHLLGFCLAVAAAAGIGHSMWWIAPLAIVSLALTFENFRAYVARFADSVTDPLTGLPNVRYLRTQAALEIDRARRSQTMLSVMLIDLDAFKAINDTYGHQAGDQALRQVGACVQQSLRSYDICARHGGDEFVAVLPGCTADHAPRKAAALESAVAALIFEPKPGVKAPIRVSVGVAVFPEDGQTLDELLAAADARMFRDKSEHHERAGAPRIIPPPALVTEPSWQQAGDREVHDRLMQAQRMQAIGQLAGGVAHDFNNVLTAILGYSELLTEQIGPDKPIGRDLHEILGAARHAASLTHQLLAFSRRQDRALKVVDLNEVVADSESLLRRLLSERIAITTKLAHGLHSIVADATQLEQIVVNLAVNARDAMPLGGPLTIETRNVEQDGVQGVELMVCDAGTGIPAAALPRIFEPFFTTKEAGKGTGLGLAAVQSIVTQMSGRITVESTPDVGTTFRIFLPSTGVAAQRSTAAAPAVAIPVPVGAETILLVEDEAAVRQFATIALERHGYRVLEAHSGEAALTLLDRVHAPIDLLMTDVVLPGIDGWELAARVGVGRPKTRVLFTTGYSERLQSAVAGAPEVQVLMKPFTAQMLLRKTREMLDRQVA